MTMGLMALKPADWIEIDSRFAEEIALRKSLLDERRDDVLAALPGSEAACREVLDQLAGFLPERFPDRFERAGTELVNRVSGDRWTVEGDVRDPLGIAGRLVQEDLCILQEVEGELRLTAGVLCFPNRWRLSDKLGRPMVAIHGPVPSYAERLGKPVDRFIGMLAPERPVWRLNWSLTDDPALFQPVGHGRRDTDPDITPENAGAADLPAGRAPDSAPAAAHGRRPLHDPHLSAPAGGSCGPPAGTWPIGGSGEGFAGRYGALQEHHAVSEGAAGLPGPGDRLKPHCH